MSNVAFTGHRPHRFAFKEESDLRCKAIKDALKRLLKRCYHESGVRHIYVGGALGVDMWVGEAVVALQAVYPDLVLHCIIPFAGHDASWTHNERERLAALYTHGHVRILSDSYHPNVYRDRNQYLVDHADCLIAVWDRRAGSRSGCAQTVRYAENRGKPVIFIDPDTSKAYKRVVVSE